MITVRPPGDKSISHRALLLAPLAGGNSVVSGLGSGRDIRSTLRVMRALGARIHARDEDGGWTARVQGGAELREPEGVLDCGNSGTSARLLAGVLVGLGLEATLDGDESLRARPMRRVVYPLQAMGARIEHLAAPDRLPFRIRRRSSGSLRTLRHRPRVASAQVKSAVLFAGVLARVFVEVREPGRSRDHSERMLRAMGVPLELGGEGAGCFVRFDPERWTGDLHPFRLRVPGDPSSGAFLAAAACLAGIPLRIEHVSENPTRTAFLDVLTSMGVAVERRERGMEAGEPVGVWVIRPPALLDAFEVGGTEIPALIDELPVLAVLAARARGTSRIRDAAELRVKESDRIERLAGNLQAIGVDVEERADGLDVRGTTARLAGRIRTGGDHRIAMAFGVLGTAGGADLEIDDPHCTDVSFPGFWHVLDGISA